uniref:DDE Tnp4 domain-containing protein n=1 Tax=Lactuca sativa TaxID=4236 RepID=A0A9R1VYN0_LACSA|nr:hypothetical protein LSAT_V11C400219720 [Lactuca sativa]
MRLLPPSRLLPFPTAYSDDTAERRRPTKQRRRHCNLARTTLPHLLAIALNSKINNQKQLKNKTDNVYNSTINTFNLSKEEWELESKHASSNLGACMEKLEKLGWGISDPRYNTVVALFGEERHRRLKEIFLGAICALDGTLVHAVVFADQQTRYMGRGKGECFQNVLGICDFNMIFTFVWVGWEGITHDSRVLKEVSCNPTSSFPFPPPDKYYLCDVAYTNTRGFMTPYCNTSKTLPLFVTLLHSNIASASLTSAFTSHPLPCSPPYAVANPVKPPAGDHRLPQLHRHTPVAYQYSILDVFFLAGFKEVNEEEKRQMVGNVFTKVMFVILIQICWMLVKKRAQQRGN